MADAFYPFVENAQADQHAASSDPEEGALQVRHAARIAVYDDAAAAPRVVEVAPSDVRTYLEEITKTVNALAKEQGGQIPFTVIRECVENLIHAYFCSPTVSILEAGNTIRFSDLGPGIQNKQRALEYGTSSATEEMKRYIRGVGSGLPYASQYMEDKGGTLSIEDNIGGGCVVTISLLSAEQRRGRDLPDDAWGAQGLGGHADGASAQGLDGQTPANGGAPWPPMAGVPGQPFSAPYGTGAPAYAHQGPVAQGYPAAGYPQPYQAPAYPGAYPPAGYGGYGQPYGAPPAGAWPQPWGASAGWPEQQGAQAQQGAQVQQAGQGRWPEPPAPGARSEQSAQSSWPDRQTSNARPEQQAPQGTWPNQQGSGAWPERQGSGAWPDQQAAQANWPDQQAAQGSWPPPAAAPLSPSAQPPTANASQAAAATIPGAPSPLSVGGGEAPSDLQGASWAQADNLDAILSDREKLALTYLLSHESCGPKELSEAYGSSQPTWSRCLAGLVTQEFVKKGGQKYHVTRLGRLYAQRHLTGPAR